MQRGDIIRVRLPEERMYRNVKVRKVWDDGWIDAWIDNYGHTWSHQALVHVSWQRGKKGGKRVH